MNANSVGSIVAALGAMYFYGTPVSPGFWIGSIIVCGAVRIYYIDHSVLLLSDSAYWLGKESPPAVEEAGVALTSVQKGDSPA